MRFSIVGVVVTASYMAGTYSGIRWLGLSPLQSNWLGCAASIVISYLGQKYFTFRSEGAHQIELPKFLLTCTIAVVFSSLSISTTSHLGIDYRIGILIAAFILPLCNFTIMNLWVFSPTKPDLKHN